MDVLESRRLYEGRVVNLRLDTLRTARGEHTYEVVEHKGAVVVIVQPTPDEMVLVRQYRRPLDAQTWEVCAGGIEDGETPHDAALRELREETGLRAKRVQALWSAYSAPGFCDELLHFFVAHEVEAGATAFDDGEDIETRTFALDELRALLRSNALRDAKTQIAVLWALTERS